jgi:hypothetical protein
MMMTARIGIVLQALLALAAAGLPQTKEYLTPKEIAKVQDAQEIDERVKVYMEAAELRLKTSEERLTGKESQPGDPLEFFSVEDLLDGYYSCLRSVMINLDDAFGKPGANAEKLKKALKSLQSTTQRAEKDLAVLKKLAEEKRLEGVWNRVNVSLDITRGAKDGAELGLSRLSGDKEKPAKPPQALPYPQSVR